MSTIPALISDREMLANIRLKILDILETGESYTIVGSRTVKNPALDKLERLETKYTNRILRANGQNAINLPDFSGERSASVADDRRKNC